MRKKKNRRGISAGTLAMLLLTLLVVAGCGAFMATIAGEAMSSRAGEWMHRIEEMGVELIGEAESELTRIRSEHHRAQATGAPPAETPPAGEPTALPRAMTTITLAAAGTVCAPRAIRDGAVTEAGEYDFSAVFEGLGDALSGADLAIATLETMTAGGAYGNFNAPVQLLDALRGSGVDLVALATERALDAGDDGLQITIGEVTARGMAYAGATREGSKGGAASMIGIDGVQVAVLSYTYGLSDEGRESGETGAVHMMETARMVQDIRQARADGANVVIVLPHWGTKNKQETPEEVREMAMELAVAGADVILGTHPNVVQGTQRLRVTRADGLEYETVVCYSLGCLLTDARTEENAAGMIARLQITYDPETRRIALGTLACLPVYVARQKTDGESVFRVIDVENAQAMDMLDETGRGEALRAAQRVREVTGQSDMEGEGQG